MPEAAPHRTPARVEAFRPNQPNGGFGEVRVNGRLQTRRIPCANPAFGFAQLEAEIEDLLMAQVHAEAATIEKKRARRKTRLTDND